MSKELEAAQDERYCLENIISSLKKEYEAFKVEAGADSAAQMRSCEAQLKPFCVADENRTRRMQDRTFNDMVVIIQKERSNLLEKAKSMSKELEAAQGEISCLENIVSSLKKEYEAFKVKARAATAAQRRSCETKLKSLCVTDENGTILQQDQTFDDMIVIAQKARSNLLKKARSPLMAQAMLEI